ncbi:MAG: PhzF family phenazine biosynthesis protein [Clostridia bacterium]|nr:PhzF family phenazine biosynthesis protein [Clostridia bacterium]
MTREYYIVDVIPVDFTYNEAGKPDLLTMKQVNPVFGKVIEPDRIAGILNLEPADLDQRYPVQEVSTGLPFLLVPLKNLANIKKAKVDVAGLMDLVGGQEAKALFLFCPETYEPDNRLNARMFGHYYGVPEDPATGSANGCLAGYLMKYDYFGPGPLEVRVEQGYEIGRKSILYLSGSRQEDDYRILVGGRVQLVAKGELVD